MAVIYSLTNRSKMAEFELSRLVDDGINTEQVQCAKGYIAWYRDEIDKSISHMQKIKDSLLACDRQLRLANYKAEDITITLIRQRYPRTLVNYLKQQGFTVEKRFPGIYYVTGNILFAMQIIVSKQLESNEHIWLHSLQNNISQEDYQQLLLHVDTLDAKEKETYGEAILEVVSKANTKQIEKWKEESSMTCPTLERIMEPELEAKRLEGRLEGERAGRLQGLLEGERTGRLQGRLEGKILAYAEIGLSVAEIAAKYSLSEEEVADIILRNEE